MGFLDSKKNQDILFWIIILITLVVIYSIPTASESAKIFFTSTVILTICYYAMMAIGLNLQTGVTGIVNFGVIFFVGIGMTFTAVFSTTFGISPLLSMILSMGVSALIGFLLAFPSLRLRTDYFAIITVGLGEVLKALLLAEPFFQTKRTFDGITIYNIGIVNVPKPFEDNYRTILEPFVSVYNFLMTPFPDAQVEASTLPYVVFLALLSILFLFLVYFVANLLVDSPYGRVLKAIREDEEVVSAHGYNIFQYKASVLAVGGALFAVPGAIIVWQTGSVAPSAIQITITFFVWGAFIIGGRGNNKGMILGGLIIAMSRILVQRLNSITLEDRQANFFLNGLDQLFRFIVVDVGGTMFGNRSWSTTFDDREDAILDLNFIQILIVGAVIVLFLRFLQRGILPELPYRPERPELKEEEL